MSFFFEVILVILDVFRRILVILTFRRYFGHYRFLEIFWSFWMIRSIWVIFRVILVIFGVILVILDILILVIFLDFSHF
jgi:hypothetical protein